MASINRKTSIPAVLLCCVFVQMYGSPELDAQSTSDTPASVSSPPNSTTAYPIPPLYDGQFFNPANRHVYQFVSRPGISWKRAFYEAGAHSIAGVVGYLATVNSQPELDFIENSVIPGGTLMANVYLGGVQVALGKWFWAAGPEKGLVFWNNVQVGAFAPWDPIFALSPGAPASPNNQRSRYLYLNSWHRAYLTSSWGAAIKRVENGGNSGYVVEYSGFLDNDPPTTPRIAPIETSKGENGPLSPKPSVKITRDEPHEGASEVQLLKSGGTFLIPVSINNAITLNFVLDSGASDVSIPADVVSTLIRTGTIRDEDFLGSQTYVLADGSTVPSETFRIRTLKVGDRELENVKGSVAKTEGTLLLGQSFLTRFRSWSSTIIAGSSC